MILSQTYAKRDHPAPLVVRKTGIDLINDPIYNKVPASWCPEAVRSFHRRVLAIRFPSVIVSAFAVSCRPRCSISRCAACLDKRASPSLPADLVRQHQVQRVLNRFYMCKTNLDKCALHLFA